MQGETQIWQRFIPKKSKRTPGSVDSALWKNNAIRRSAIFSHLLILNMDTDHMHFRHSISLKFHNIGFTTYVVESYNTISLFSSPLHIHPEDPVLFYDLSFPVSVLVLIF